MNIQELTKELLTAIENEPIIKKHIYGSTWLSGSSTTVYPIIFLQKEVRIQLDISKNVFKKFIERFVKQNSDLVVCGGFSANDGSCPSELYFYYNIPENQRANKAIEVA